MKDCDVMEVFVSAVEEVIFKEWRHEGFIGGWSSAHANFEIDGKEYALNLREVPDGGHWSECLDDPLRENKVGRNIFKDALEGKLDTWENADEPAEEVADDGKYCRDIPGFPGYKCTRDGDVIGPRGMLTPTLSSFGRYVSLYVDGTTKTTAVHTLMMRTFRPKEWAPGKAVIHLDGDKYNNKLENLAFKGDK